jgi:hypothetical protein
VDPVLGLNPADLGGGHVVDPTLEVLPGTHPLNRPTTVHLAVLGEQGADIDDALALLARDAGPVVGVGGVGQVLVLLVLLADRLEEVEVRMPPDSPAMTRLMASFLARRTMFSIMAPEAKSR